MPRVYTQRAGKDYPKDGIKKGDVYYQWAFFRGPTQRSKTRPRASQTIASPTLSGAYAVQEGLDDALAAAGSPAAASSPADYAEALNNAVSELESNIEEHEESISNMEQTFTGGSPTIDEFTERRDKLEDWKTALESAAGEIDGLDAADYKDVVEDAGKDVNEYADLSDLGKGAMKDAAAKLAQDAAGEFPL